MKKNNRVLNTQGFALAETLIVTLFLMIIFTMIFTNIVPLVGQYEKIENYDNVDGKYATYWIKTMIEDLDYNFSSVPDAISTNKYTTFTCNNFSDNTKKTRCINLVQALEVDGCNNSGGNCKIFITSYRIGSTVNTSNSFKYVVKNDANNSTFSRRMKEYIRLLPDYTAESLNGAKYRVIVIYKHNNVYSFANMEVLR